MKNEESRKYKALYFDLRVTDLKKYYSRTNPNSAYAKIKRFFMKKRFSHEQYSGYHSTYKTTDLAVFDMIREMSQTFSWLKHCINHFEVTDVGPDYDLTALFVPQGDCLKKPQDTKDKHI